MELLISNATGVVVTGVLLLLAETALVLSITITAGRPLFSNSSLSTSDVMAGMFSGVDVPSPLEGRSRSISTTTIMPASSLLPPCAKKLVMRTLLLSILTVAAIASRKLS